MKPSIKRKIYLATPYTHGNGKGLLSKFITWLRYKRVTRKTGELLAQGYNVFSPITHTHPLPKYLPDSLNVHSFWLELDLPWIDACDELWIYMQPGWESSKGIKVEIAHARKTNKIIKYI